MGGFNTGLGKGGGQFNAGGGGGGFDTGLGGGARPKPRLKPIPAVRGGAGASQSIRHGGGGGVLGWLGSKLSLAGHDLEQMPGGLYHGALDLERAKSDAVTGHFGRAFHDVKPLYEGQIRGFVGSIRHPGRDPFQTAMNLAPGLDVLGRVGEAGIAARAAEGGRVAEAARALTRGHGEVEPRVLRSGERETTLIHSRNAGKRFFVEKPYDALVQRAMDREAQAEGVGRVTRRVSAHGKARIAGALAEEQRAVQRMNAIPADRLERSALRLSKLPLKAGGKIHSAALELTSTQTRPEVAAAFHEEQALKLRQTGEEDAARRNEGVAKLYRKVAKNDLVHFDPSRPDGEKVFINPAKTRLAAADAALAHAGHEGEQIIREHNLMSAEGQRERINAPAQVRSGAEYNAPTPGKLGIESPALKEARAQLEKAERLFAKVQVRAMGKIGNSRSVMHEFASRPMTEDEAHARLAELDKQYQELVDKTVPHISPHTNETSRNGRSYSPEQLRRNFESGKTGKKLETVREEEQRLADEKLREIASEHAGKGKPFADHLANLIHERDTLRKTLASRADAAIFGHKPPELPHVAGLGYKYELPWMRDPEVQRFAGHVSILKDKVQKLEALHHNRIEPTGLIGGEGALPGRNFVGYRSSEKAGEPAVLTAAQRKRIGEPQSPIDSKAFTGENIRQGKVPKNVAFSAARHYRQLAKFANTLSLRKSIIESDGSLLKRSGRDILIRVPGEDAKPLTDEMKQALGEAHEAVHDHASLEEIHAGTEEGLRVLHQFLNQHILDRAEASGRDAIGTPAPDGYRWVDGKLAEQLQKDALQKAAGVRTLPGKYMDNVNSLITALTVYFKVGHVFTRALTNAATNIMQGSLRPDESVKSYLLWKKLSPEDQARALAAAGQQGFAALPHEGSEGLAGRAVSGLARGGSRFWARHFDAPFRFNSLAYELRRIGYDSPDKFREALDAIQNNGRGMPAHEWSKVSAAFRRADREAISYDRLNEFEKRFLARAIWFYPWVKGSSAFTVRSILEHPYKMAALGNLGAQGREEQLKELGPVPSYEQGLVRLDNHHNPLTTDFSTISPAATLGQLLNVPTVPGAVAQQFNPVLGSAAQYTMGVNQYGEPSNAPLSDALQSLIAPTPEAQIAETLTKGKGKHSSARMFQKTPGSEFMRYLIGPAMPRRVNRAALAKAASREHARRYTVYSTK